MGGANHYLAGSFLLGSLLVHEGSKVKDPNYSTQFYTWITSLVGFFILLFLAKADFSTSSGWMLILWLIDVGVGSIAFLWLVGKLIDGLRSKDKKVRKRAFNNTLATAGLFVSFFLYFFAFIDYESPVKQATTNALEDNSQGFKRCYFDDNWITVNQDEDCEAEIAKYKQKHEVKAPVEGTTNTTKSTSPSSAEIDCIGPYGIHVSLTKEQCAEFNGTWAATEQEVINDVQAKYQQPNYNTPTVTAPNTTTTGLDYQPPAAPEYESIPQPDSVEFTAPESELEFIERPVEKKCYKTRIGTVCY